jgi:hypothetical protein
VFFYVSDKNCYNTIRKSTEQRKMGSSKRMKLVAKQPIHLLFLLLIGVSACTSPSSGPFPSPTVPSTREVVATAWTALIEGQLVLEDGCLKVVEPVSQNTYTLVFPPDFSATISGDTVRITSGLVTGDRRDDLIMIGDAVQFGGGTPGILNDELQKTVPSNCQGPYWVFGGFLESKGTPEP